MDKQRAAALAADQVSRDAFQAWLKEKNKEERIRLNIIYEESVVEAKRLWDIVGPDPLLSQLHKAQEEQDKLEGHED